MPFTPFHFGHAIAFTFWDYKKKRFDLVAGLIGSVIVDIRLVYIFFFGGVISHEILHGFLAACILGVSSGIILHLFRKPIHLFTKKINWEQETTLIQKILSATSMAIIHIILDSIFYPEMKPWRPFTENNQFLGIVSSATVYLICIVGFIIGIIEIIGYLIWRNHQTERNPDESAYYQSLSPQEP